MVRRVLVLNAGSSSLKASVLEGDAIEPVAAASILLSSESDADAGVRAVLDALARAGVDPSSCDAAGHRIVHGGSRFVSPLIVDETAVSALESLSVLAPLHNPVAVRCLITARTALPRLAHVACFDTAFHANLPPAAYLYALPYEWAQAWGYRRFGFHGLSVAWALERSAQLLDRAPSELGLVVAHLGSGCSVTAVRGGVSVGTSMGMTPLEGLVMSTRAGSVDPGVLLAAQRDHGLDADALEDVLERRSGLLGISGISGDMRQLVAQASGNVRAALAIEVFVRSAAAGIAAAATALPRLDAITFTGGIGERAGSVRTAIIASLASIGVSAAEANHDDGDAVLAREGVAVLRVIAREDVIIARQVLQALAGS